MGESKIVELSSHDGFGVPPSKPESASTLSPQSPGIPVVPSVVLSLVVFAVVEGPVVGIPVDVAVDGKPVGDVSASVPVDAEPSSSALVITHAPVASGTSAPSDTRRRTRGASRTTMRSVFHRSAPSGSERST
jgi:hypothetical protein